MGSFNGDPDVLFGKGIIRRPVAGALAQFNGQVHDAEIAAEG